VPNSKGPRDAANVRGRGHQPVEVDDVFQATARLFLPLLRLVLPPTGRRRAAEHPPPVQYPSNRPVPALSGEDIGLVRPYLVAHERRQEARRRRARRRVLLLAVQGLDIGPRPIRAVGVSA